MMMIMKKFKMNQLIIIYKKIMSKKGANERKKRKNRKNRKRRSER